MTTIHRAIDALVTACTASSILPSGAMVCDTYAYDNTPALLLVIGCDDSPMPVPNEAVVLTSAEGSGEWTALGNLERGEDYTVRGYCSAYTGNSGNLAISTARASAAALLRVVDKAIVDSHGNLGLVNAGSPGAEQACRSAIVTLRDFPLEITASARGIIATWRFGVHITTRLTGS